MSDASSITDILTPPTITNETSPHFAEALGATLLSEFDSRPAPRRAKRTNTCRGEVWLDAGAALHRDPIHDRSEQQLELLSGAACATATAMRARSF
jgi:hypothetical protein